MIPDEQQTKALWDKYNLPQQKRQHVSLVARVAVFLAEKMNNVNLPLLRAAALLHDIDKAVPRLPGEKHPDTGVRILMDEGMNEIAEIVKTHSLHTILNPNIAPKSWEEKILYLSDKMVKYDIVGVDERFTLWRKESLPPDAEKILTQTYQPVKRLEQEIFSIAHVSLEDVQKLA